MQEMRMQARVRVEAGWLSSIYQQGPGQVRPSKRPAIESKRRDEEREISVS